MPWFRTRVGLLRPLPELTGGGEEDEEIFRDLAREEGAKVTCFVLDFIRRCPPRRDPLFERDVPLSGVGEELPGFFCAFLFWEVR